MNRKRDLVELEWLDSASNDRWAGIETFDAVPVTCRTVGWVVAEDKKGVALVSSVSIHDGNVRSGCGYMVIPRSVIVKRRVLRKGK